MRRLVVVLLASLALTGLAGGALVAVPAPLHDALRMLPAPAE